MPLKQIVEGVYAIPLGFVNVFLLDRQALTLIDTGIPGSQAKILAGVAGLGRQPGEVKDILITHLHRDHTGSLNEMKKATGAGVWAHPADADLLRQGISMRPNTPAPGLVYGLVYRLFVAPRQAPRPLERMEVEHEVQDGQVIPLAGGIQAFYTPGHTAGHLVFLWPEQGGVLFVGDALTHYLRLGHPPIYEDYPLAKRSLQTLAGLEYETICFSHGGAIVGRGSQQIKQRIKGMV